jgi:hypothetical protein
MEYAAGNKRSADSKKVYINTEQDADDFFLTTDNNLYEKLADKGFNTILQDNKNCTDDGSLSVYCGGRISGTLTVKLSKERANSIMKC